MYEGQYANLAQNNCVWQPLYTTVAEQPPVPYIECKCGRDIVILAAVIKAFREAKHWQPSFKVTCDDYRCKHEQVVDGNTSFRIK